MNEFNLEIIEKQNDVTYEAAKVDFPAYEEYKEKATAVAEYISQMDVNEENIKEAKATLAKARKLTDKLTRARIDMKKEILASYTDFENKVKEIIDIIGDADKEVRAKVKDLEEIERDKKRQQIYELWLKRIPAYDFDLLNAVLPNAFDRWLTPKHLNKTTSMKSVETDMTEWIQNTYNDMQTALGMGKEYLVAYGWKGNLAEAIEAVKTQKETEDRLNNLVDDDEAKETFIVYGKKDIDLTKMLLNDHNINYILL